MVNRQINNSVSALYASDAIFSKTTIVSVLKLKNVTNDCKAKMSYEHNRKAVKFYLQIIKEYANHVGTNKALYLQKEY